MKVNDRIVYYNYEETWKLVVTVTKIEEGIHPSQLDYIRDQYEDEEEFNEWYSSDDYETVYLSDGNYWETDLRTGISKLNGTGEEVDYTLMGH